MFDEEKYYHNIAEKLLDAYTIDEILEILGVNPEDMLVELMLAGVLPSIHMEDFFDVEVSEDDDS